MLLLGELFVKHTPLKCSSWWGNAPKIWSNGPAANYKCLPVFISDIYLLSSISCSFKPETLSTFLGNSLLIRKQSQAETLTRNTIYSISVQKSVIAILWFMRTQLVLHNCAFNAFRFLKSNMGEKMRRYCSMVTFNKLIYFLLHADKCDKRVDT